MVDSSGETRYCHDRRGNVVRRVQTIPNGTLETRWEYDLSDRVSSITYPSGPIVNYVRDSAGRVTGVMYKATPGSTPQSIVASATYLPFGPLATITYGNGRTLTKAYDRNYAIDAIGTTPSNGLTVDYKVDVVGNITHIDEGSPAPIVRAFEYDGLDRLRFVRDQGGAVVEGYSYDAVGNRLTKQIAAQAPVPLAYYPGTHRLSAVGGVSRVYDGAGNTTGIGVRTLGFDQPNRLVGVSDPALGALGAYTYNGRGERVAKFSQSVLVSPQTSTVYYVFGMDGTTLAEALLPPPEPCVCPPDVVCTDAVCDEEQRGAAVVAGHEEDILGLQWRHYVYLEGVPIAVLDAGGLTYLETDHLGSPRAAISPTTNASVWRWTFAASAFGENLPNEQPGGSAPFKLNLRFPGQYYDAESGMHYNYFRDYEPGTGRYVESDPIGLRGGISTYGYALASPLEFSDPTGEASVLGAAAVGCVAGCLANVGAPFGKCVYSGLQKGDSLEECNRDCKPTFCAFVNQCFQGCLAGGLLAGVAGAALGGSMTATYGVMVGGGTSVLAGSLYKEVFKFDVCGALSGLGPTGERLGEGQ